MQRNVNQMSFGKEAPSGFSTTTSVLGLKDKLDTKRPEEKMDLKWPKGQKNEGCYPSRC